MMTIREALNLIKESGLTPFRPLYCLMNDNGHFVYLCYGKIDGEEEYYWGGIETANAFRSTNDIKIGLKYVGGGVWGDVIIAKREGDELVDANSGDPVVDLSKEV